MKKVQNAVKIHRAGNKALTMWYDKTCEVWAQGLFAFGTVERLQIVPGGQVCVCAITQVPIWAGKTRPLYGWLVYAPANLVLEFGEGCMVELMQTDTERMRAWYKDTRPWLAVGKQGDST